MTLFSSVKFGCTLEQFVARHLSLLNRLLQLFVYPWSCTWSTPLCAAVHYTARSQQRLILPACNIYISLLVTLRDPGSSWFACASLACGLVRSCNACTVIRIELQRNTVAQLREHLRKLCPATAYVLLDCPLVPHLYCLLANCTVTPRTRPTQPWNSMCHSAGPAAMSPMHHTSMPWHHTAQTQPTIGAHQALNLNPLIMLLLLQLCHCTSSR